MRWFRHPGRALDAYLDGELDGDVAGLVGAHLSHCSRCRRRVVLTRQIRRSLRAMAEQT